MLILSNFIYSTLLFTPLIFRYGGIIVVGSEIAGESTRLHWLQHHNIFNRNHVGITFGLHDQKNFTTEQMNFLHQNIVHFFNKVVIVFHDDSDTGINIFLSELQVWQHVAQNTQVNVLVSKSVDLKRLYRTRSRSNDILDVPEFYHLEYETNITTMVSRIDELKDLYLNYKLEYAFNMTNCSSLLTASASKPTDSVGETLRFMRAKSVIFSFEESQEITKLGAQKMFERRLLIMKQCQKLVFNWDLDNQVKVSYMMLHYGTSSQFYANKWEMVNFIEYWQRLSNWARDENTTVIFSSAIDSFQRFMKRDGPFVEMGWWRLREQPWNEREQWINKIEDALLRFPELNTRQARAGGLPADPTTTKPIEPSTAAQPTAHSQMDGIIGNANIYFMLIIMISLIAFIAVVIATIFLIRKRIHKPILTKQEINDFFHGEEPSLESEHVHAAYKGPYEKTRYEIGMEIVTFEEDAPLLGSGMFGKVCLGQIIMQQEETTQVAIKMLDPKKIVKVAVKNLLSEIKLLSFVGNHEHIIQLVGANTQDIKFGRVVVFLELCEFGTLKSQLHKLKLSLQSDNASIITVEEQMNDMDDERMSRYLQMMSMNKTPLDPSITEDLLRWSHEICMGMAYLATKNVVHADLTTRNVLLNGEKDVKICSFGLPSRMDNYKNAMKKQEEPYNWKWIAPETLKLGEFSEKSDVWAYGVTLWEIFSLGAQPFPGVAWSGGFADMLEVGYRLGEPEYNDLNMYSVMRECWIAEAQNRPSFAELLATTFS